MSAIVFVTWDGGGNVPPAVGLAQELQRRGHEVRFLGHRTQADSFARQGLPFTGYRTAHDFDVTHPKAPIGILRVFSDRALGRDVVTDLQSHPADLVLVDCYLFSAMAALRKAGIPYITFEHSFDGYLRAATRGPLGLLMRLRGFSPLRLIDDGKPVLVPTLAELDPKAGPRVVHTGPIVTGVPTTPSEPTVLISLSTVGFGSLVSTWQRILDAVDGLPARVIVTAGPSLDLSSVRIPDGVEFHSWLPHAEVMPECSMVLTHGGHATAMMALAHDLPLLIIPLDDKTDQPTIAATLSEDGAAIALKRNSSSTTIRQAIETLLVDGPHRAVEACSARTNSHNPTK